MKKEIVSRTAASVAILLVMMLMTAWFVGCDNPSGGDPALTGTVSINGTARVGETLTANTNALDGTGAITYQWQRASAVDGAFTAIANAAAPAYTLVQADLGKYIRVAVSLAGYKGTLTSEATAAVAAAVTPDDITWTAAANGVNNEQDSTAITFTFSAAVSGLTAEDITVAEGTGSAVKGTLTGTGITWSLALSEVTTAGNVRVSITKTGIETTQKDVAVYKQGQTAEITWTAEADGEADSETSTAITFTFSGAVSGLTAEDITITPEGNVTKGALTGDGTTWSLALSAVTTAGDVSVSISKTGIASAAQDVAVYKAPPVLSGTVSISGTAQAGQTLTAVITDLGGEGAISYQWQRADPAGGEFAAITDAAASTYTPVTGDVGKIIRVVVSRAGYTGTLASAATAAVAAADDPALTGTVSITGTTELGQTLTANTESLEGEGDIAYQWQQADPAGGGFSAIADAAAAAYTLVTADVGKVIRVVVSRAGYSGTQTATTETAVTGVTPANLAAYLGTLPNGTADTPATVVFAPFDVTGADWGGAVKTALAASTKYVALDLSACSAANNTITGAESPSGNHFNVVKGVYIKGIILPSSLITIGNYAFYNCNALTGVTIPDTVTSIGSYAFRDCLELSGVTIPERVETIGEYAFYGCMELDSITIPGSVETISNRTFQGCSDLGSVTISQGVESIGTYAFYNCSNLTGITIPNTVTSIGNYAFRNCISLISANVIIQSTALTLGTGVFQGCNGTGFTTIPALPASITAIPGNTFRDCTSLTSVTIPGTVETIETNAFYGCTNLASVTIENGVGAIGANAFSGCTLLASIAIPNSVQSIGENAFQGCGFTSLPAFPSGLTTLTGFGGCTGLTGVLTIPDGITSIGNYAFQGCTGLTGVTIDDGVQSIGTAAFENCTSLESVTIPDLVTTIGDSAFYGCALLSGSVTIPAGVGTIGASAFKGCTLLTGVTISSGVETISASAFENTGLTGVTIPGSVETIGSAAFKGSKLTGSLIIPGGVKTIGTGAFENCTGLTGVEIPGTVTSAVGFSGCTNLESVTIAEGVTTIGTVAFDGCTKITTLAIPSTVTTIGTAAFRGCGFTSLPALPSGLKTIAGFNYCTSLPANLEIPSGIETIGDGAFDGCTQLTSVTIPDSVTKILTTAFRFCSQLASVTIPSGVTLIDSNAFYATGLTSIVIPDKVTTIGQRVFYSCAALESVTISASVTSIGSEAFGVCTKLASVTFLGATTPITYANSFSNNLKTFYDSQETKAGTYVWSNNAWSKEE